MNGALNKKIPTAEEVERFICELFKGSVCYKGEAKGRLITSDTLCCDFFPPICVREAQSMQIGEPIENKFKLKNFEFKIRMPYHDYIRLGKQENNFYIKHPKDKTLTFNYPLRKFAEMVYDLILIKNHMPMS